MALRERYGDDFNDPNIIKDSEVFSLEDLEENNVCNLCGHFYSHFLILLVALTFCLHYFYCFIIFLSFF